MFTVDYPDSDTSGLVRKTGGIDRGVWPIAWSYLRHGPGHLAMYTLGRFNGCRTIAVHLNRWQNPPARHGASNVTALQPIVVSEAIAQLKRDGACENLCLTESSLEELSNFCKANKCLGDGDPNHSFHWTAKSAAESEYGTKFSVGHYSNLTLQCPAADRLSRDPILRGIAQGYFNAEPALIAVRAWWSFATNEEPKATNGQTYHFDIDGYRSVAFFFYLTDVDAASGAHIYVRGSHLRKRVSHLVSLHKSRSDREIEEFYPADDIRVISGKAGTGFAEDTFCFHKGSAPRSRDRLMLQVRFGLRDYGTGRED